MHSSASDRIEKEIVLKVPRSRVWRAISDSREFAAWFHVRLDEPFVAGKEVSARFSFRGTDIESKLHVVRIEPETQFAFRWHPYAVEPGVDYSSEPTTLVSFELSDAPGGTLLRIVESGFDQIPIARRATAFRMNGEGWSAQSRNIEAYLAKAR
jgi:uncharacterized protein YndB with AHSA1/START domain